MEFAQIAEFISAPFIYADVTQEEYDALTVSHLRAIVNGVLVIGTNVPVEALASKEVEQPVAEEAAE